MFLPLYGGIRSDAFDLRPTVGLQDMELDYPVGRVTFGVSTAELPNSERTDGASLSVDFLDSPELYDRDGYYTSDDDEPVRWATLCRGVLEVLARSEWAPDVIHCNDWHTGLLPLYLNEFYRDVPSLASTQTLLSLHNVGFQGTFYSEVIDELGLSQVRHRFHQQHLADGLVRFLETGVIYASWLSTVSETYAGEIQAPEHGMGLDPLLQARADHLVGIINGIDPDEWSPQRDPTIPTNFSADDWSGKEQCRQALLTRFNIADHAGSGGADRRPPVVAIVSRFTAQKGFELVHDALVSQLQHDRIRLVILGSGETRYERFFQRLRDSFPDRIGVYLGFDEELAHWIEAGADVFLMPSRYEPCGLNQLYSMSYGTVPLVRNTGGLADTVTQWDPETRSGTGFLFDEFRPAALTAAFDDVMEAWADPGSWHTLMRNGMTQDFSWERQSAHYVDLYNQILET